MKPRIAHEFVCQDCGGAPRGKIACSRCGQMAKHTSYPKNERGRCMACGGEQMDEPCPACGNH